MLSSATRRYKLRPLKDNDKHYEEIEARIRRLWLTELYWPLIKEFDVSQLVLKNSKAWLLDAIKSGRVQYYRGSFSGKFNASVSRELKEAGAKWDRKTGTFKLPFSAMPYEMRNAISASESYFRSKIQLIDQKLTQVLPEEIADRLKIADHFDSVLWKVDKELKGTLRGLTITPQLSKQHRKRIADEWQNNLKLEIKKWTQKEIVTLRKDMQASVFAGNRHEAAVKIIQRSHAVSINKAKFLARQETRLLLTKFKQVRYEDAGVNKYEWGISNNPVQAKNAPYVKGQVRHDHGELEGMEFSWNNPPVTNRKTGARNNPGQDYNCRCFAIPIVKFKREKSK